MRQKPSSSLTCSGGTKPKKHKETQGGAWILQNQAPPLVAAKGKVREIK
jgi:hypothetical protein